MTQADTQPHAPATDDPQPAVLENPPPPEVPLPLLAIRGGIGGILMGLANLVPGISGGTMLLAAGVYPRFIAAIGELTTLKFRKASLVVLGSVVLAAAVAVVGLAGPVKELVVHQRWIMYSLFIGLTLGGVPVVGRLIRTAGGMNRAAWIGVAAGFAGMAALASVQMQGTNAADRSGFIFMLLAGVAGASAMILPGVSGGYLLLVLGVYVPILAGISDFKDAASAGDTAALLSVGGGIILPVGLGVVVGIVVVSNVLKWLLSKYERPTLGVLQGLLLGAVVGLYPFQEPVKPVPGERLDRTILLLHDGVLCYKSHEGKEFVPVKIKNQHVIMDAAGEPIFQDTGRAVVSDDYPTRLFEPSVVQVAGVLGLIAGGFAVTMLIDRFGREKKPATQKA